MAEATGSLPKTAIALRTKGTMPVNLFRMREHSRYVLDVLGPIAVLRASLEIPSCHHEKRDGTGYPNGLDHRNIRFTARMFAAADVWDALTSDRPYRAGWPINKVRAHFRSLAGSHLDPKVVDCLLELTKGLAADDEEELPKAA